jgi:hypothetical protein
MDGSTSFDGFRIPDVLWNKLEQILPKYPSSSKGGRPRQNLRSIMDAIFYRLRTGCQWKAILTCFAPGSTAHQYFQEWVELGLGAHRLMAIGQGTLNTVVFSRDSLWEYKQLARHDNTSSLIFALNMNQL